MRVFVAEGPQGRTDLRLASHGREFSFGRFLTDDERRDFSNALTGALIEARTRADLDQLRVSRTFHANFQRIERALRGETATVAPAR